MLEQDVEGEPAHHARRPMNAFLIFCKRHRSVVRDRYPNLENRSITKILGEWWANLDEEEKACYTGLAKQYKDAFFSANPDFKWYKLPAPPLRNQSSRPRDHEKPSDPHPDLHDIELEKTNNNSTKIDFNKKRESYEPKSPSMFTPGKLADEAQMGGISRLLDNKTESKTNYYSPTPFNFNAISTPRPQYTDRPVEDSIRELQDALSETTKVFEENFDDNAKRYSNDQFTNQHVIDQVVIKKYCRDEDGYQRNWYDEDKTRSGRSCKGKRYQEFMALGGLIMNKRQKRDYHDKTPDDSYNASCSWDPGSSRSEESTLTNDSKPDYNELDTETKSETKHESSDPIESDNNANKTFKAEDFNLDAKIAALPSLSLEKFQQKKRDSKRRKKSVNLNSKSLETSPIVNSVPDNTEQRREMVENWRETVIGSQKRKPRKISITRYEINSFASSMGTSASYKASPEIKLATEAPCTAVPNMQVCNPPSHAHDSIDLFALATLAEVASNTSKIDGATIMEHYTAKSGGNASTV